MLSSRISALVDVICCSIRCFGNIFVVFSIFAAGSYISKSVFLGSKLLFKQVLLKTMEHSLLYLILLFQDSLLFF